MQCCAGSLDVDVLSQVDSHSSDFPLSQYRNEIAGDIRPAGCSAEQRVHAVIEHEDLSVLAGTEQSNEFPQDTQAPVVSAEPSDGQPLRTNDRQPVGAHGVTDDLLLPGRQKRLPQDTRGPCQLAGTSDGLPCVRDVLELEDRCVLSGTMQLNQLSQGTGSLEQLAGLSDGLPVSVHADVELEDHSVLARTVQPNHLSQDTGGPEQSSVVSVFDFMKKTVLPTLDVNSRQYLLLQEFLAECNKSSDSGPVCEVRAIDVHASNPASNPGAVVSAGASALNDGTVVSPETSDMNTDVMPDSNCSPSSDVPYSELSRSLRQPLTTEEHTAVKAGGECDSKSRKRFFCLFCEKPCIKIKQHLVSQHSDAAEVVEMQSKKGQEMEKYLLRLRNLGNHKHNCSVLQSGVGTLVVAYTHNDTAVEHAKNYAPCPSCYGYYECKQLWSHHRYRCLWRPQNEEQTERNVVAKGRSLLPVWKHSGMNTDVMPDSNCSSSSDVPYPDLSRCLRQPLTTEEHTTDNAQDGCDSKSRKRFFCLFCEKSCIKIKQHLVSQHSDAAEVVEMQSKKGQEMEKYLLRLRNLGNHKHNCSVLQSGVGTLVVAYTHNGTAVEHAKNYAPCPSCYGYYERKQLWRHHRYRCLWRPQNKEQTERNVVAKGRSLLPVPKCIPSQTCEIVGKVKKDKVSRTAVNDTAKMSEILPVMESGQGEQLTGRSLDEISVDMNEGKIDGLLCGPWQLCWTH